MNKIKELVQQYHAIMAGALTGDEEAIWDEAIDLGQEIGLGKEDVAEMFQ